LLACLRGSRPSHFFLDFGGERRAPGSGLRLGIFPSEVILWGEPRNSSRRFVAGELLLCKFSSGRSSEEFFGVFLRVFFGTVFFMDPGNLKGRSRFFERHAEKTSPSRSFSGAPVLWLDTLHIFAVSSSSGRFSAGGRSLLGLVEEVRGSLGSFCKLFGALDA